MTQTIRMISTMGALQPHEFSSTPTAVEVEGAWSANITNAYNHQFADHFFYTIYAEKGGVMYSTDPEVENESNPGG